MDATTIIEVIKKLHASRIESAVDELMSWCSDKMNVNTRKTKKMVLEPLARNPPPSTQHWQSDSRQSGTVQGARSDSQPVTEMERTLRW